MWLSWLWPWRRNRRAPRTAHVVLYTREGCHLCEDVWTQLEEARGRYPLTLEAIDIDSDPALAVRHGEEIPVVLVNGQLRFRGRVNPVLLERLLRAECSS